MADLQPSWKVSDFLCFCEDGYGIKDDVYFHNSVEAHKYSQ